MAFEPQSVRVNKIYLDPENPRHEMLPDEPAIIRFMLKNEKVRNLAKDVAEAGGTSPLELIALIEHPKIKSAFVVVEGNRRVCALKLLLDPDKAGSEKHTQYFDGLKRNMHAPITKVPAIVFNSRDAARRWFALRHKGAQDGVGTKTWEADQITRFNLRNSSKDPNVQALLAIDHVKTHKLLTPEEIAGLSITTITRYLSNPVVRHALGLADANTLDILVPDAEFERALVKLLRDSLDPKHTGVSSRSSAGERKAYAARLSQEGFAAVSHGTQRHKPRETGNPDLTSPAGHAHQPSAPAQTSAQAGSATSQGRDNRSPDKRTYVIGTGFTAKIKDKTLKRLYDELKGINDVEHQTFCAVYLLRTVIEKSVTIYLKSKNIEPKRQLHEKLKQLATQLTAEGMGDRELKYLRTMSNSVDDENSPDTMGHYVHGGAIPTASYVFRLWDNMEPVMRRVLGSA